jgi:hypothetical protein
VNDQSKSAGPHDPRVNAALREYLERLDRGEPIDREEFLARHAPIAGQLRSFIAAEDEAREAGAETPLHRAQDSTKSFVQHGQQTVAPQPAKSPAAKTASKEQLQSTPAASPAAQSSDRQRAGAGASQVRKSLKPKALTESDLASLEELAKKSLAHRDYEQVIQVIELIPEERRNAALETLLEKARGRADEIAFLICEIDEAERLNEGQTALKGAEALLKLKPGHHRALEVQEKYSRYSDIGMARIGVLEQFRLLLNDGSWIPLSVLAFGLAIFGVMMGVIVIYLNRTAVVIDIQDPGVEVAVKGTALTITGPGQQSVKVTPGDQELKISCAGLETITKSFMLKKGEKKTVTVSILDKKLVARLENENLPLASDADKRGSNPPAVGPKSNVATTASKSFGRPFLVTGEWTIENDEVIQPTLAAGDDQQVRFFPFLAFGDATLSNYDLTLEAKKTGGSDQVGLLFHWQGRENYRKFCLAAKDLLDFSYYHNGTWGRERANLKTLNYSSNRWYALKVKVRGDTYWAYLDGALQFVQTDTRLTHGRICLFTATAAARFRRIKVTDPRGKVLFEGLPELPPASNKTPPKVQDRQ